MPDFPLPVRHKVVERDRAANETPVDLRIIERDSLAWADLLIRGGWAFRTVARRRSGEWQGLEHRSRRLSGAAHPRLEVGEREAVEHLAECCPADERLAGGHLHSESVRGTRNDFHSATLAMVCGGLESETEENPGRSCGATLDSRCRGGTV